MSYWWKWFLWVCRNQVFFILANNSRWKYPEHSFFGDWKKWQEIVWINSVQNFNKKYGSWSSMVVGARQSFRFFRKNTYFLANSRALSKFLYGILHYLISISKSQKNQSIKPNFILGTRSTLRRSFLQTTSRRLLLWFCCHPVTKSGRSEIPVNVIYFT